MPEPTPTPGTAVPMWPDSLPLPDADGFVVTAGLRAEVADRLLGNTRLTVKARTAPPEYAFKATFTRAEMQAFEEWYRDAVENFDGEFYARWIGGSRVVAFAEPYALVPIGDGWILTGRLVRTRIDDTACSEYIETWFGNIYRANLSAPDIYEADLAAPDIYAPDFTLEFIAEHEC